MIRQWAIACASLFVLAACTTGGTPDGATGDAIEPDGYVKIAFDGKRATPAERKACAAAGGTVEPGGLLGYDQCVQPYADAGAACKSSDDCLGRCLLSPDSGDDAGQPTEDGVCQSTDSPFGCFAEVDGGIVQWAICVD